MASRNIIASTKLLKSIIQPSPCIGIYNRGFKRWMAPTLRVLKYRQDYNESRNKTAVIPRYSFVEWNRNAELFAFGKRLKEEFHIEVLNQAFVHRSYIIQEESKQLKLGLEDPQIDLKDNRELIKLGEELINKYVNMYLSYSFPKLPKEGIKALLDYLTSEETLTHISKYLGTKDIIMCDSYPPDNKTLADTFSAIVGALSKSSTEERVFLFVRDFVVTNLAGKNIDELYVIDNPYQTLCEILQRDNKSAPEPRLIGQSAPETVMATYNVGIYLDKELIGQGYGESIDIAISSAARDVLNRWFNITESAPSIRYDVNHIDKTFIHPTIHEWSSKSFKLAS